MAHFFNRLAITAATVVIATGLIATPALAKHPNVTVTAQRPADDIPQMHVSHADLNLSSDAGRRSLNYRVGAAVRSVCGVDSGWHQLAETMATNQCTAAAWVGARSQMAAVLDGSRALAANGALPLAAIVISAPVGQ